MLTAYHNLSEKDTVSGSFAIMKEFERGEVEEKDVFRLKFLGGNKDEDWAVLELKKPSYGGFNSIARICPVSSIPKIGSKITIADYPVGVFTHSHKIACCIVQTSIDRFEVNPSPPVSPDKEAVIVPQKKKSRRTESVDKAVIVQGGRSIGSCGAPYFADDNSVVAFHYSSIDDFDASSNDSRSYTASSVGRILCRLPEFAAFSLRILRQDLNV